MDNIGNALVLAPDEEEALQNVKLTPGWESRVQIRNGLFQQSLNRLQQAAASSGAQFRAWLFADRFRVAFMQYTATRWRENYVLYLYEEGNEQQIPLVALGTDQDGNYCFRAAQRPGTRPGIVMAKDLSWISFPDGHVQLPAATPEQCDKAHARGLARRAYLNQKFELFSDFFAAIAKAYNGMSIEDEKDMAVYRDDQGEVIAIARIPAINRMAIASYKEYDSLFGDVAEAGQSPEGGRAFTGTVNGQQFQFDMSPDGEEVHMGGKRFWRIIPELALILILLMRRRADKRFSYQDYVNMYNNWQAAYERQLNYVNNVNVKEIYKFSARSSMADYQQRMREVRARAARAGYNLPVGRYENADNLANQAEINRYQWARDGVKYGNHYGMKEIYNGYYMDNWGNGFNLDDLKK